MLNLIRKSKLILLFCSLFYALNANAGPVEQAERIHQRLACSAPNSEVWNQMESLIRKELFHEAALLATTQKGFYNCFLKQFFSPFVSEESDKFLPLNDFIALGIGIVKDDLPFTDILAKEYLYVADDKYQDGTSGKVPPYSLANNQHFLEIEKLDLNLKDVLVQKNQKELTQFAQSGGALTTRAFGKAFLNMGTNRIGVFRAIETFTCRNKDEMKDPTLPRSKIGRDIPRTDKGSSTDFINECGSCHAGVDSARGAFAFLDYENNTLIYSDGQVREKYHRGSETFPDGYAQSDDSWENLWVEGKNADLGFPKNLAKGKGISEFAKMLSATETIKTCMSRRALETVCQVDSKTSDFSKQIDYLAENFSKNDEYNLRKIFALAATLCMGQ